MSRIVNCAEKAREQNMTNTKQTKQERMESQRIFFKGSQYGAPVESQYVEWKTAYDNLEARAIEMARKKGMLKHPITDGMEDTTEAINREM